MLFWEFEQAVYVYDKWFKFANVYVERPNFFGPFMAYGKSHRDSFFGYSLCCLVGLHYVASNHHDIY